MVASVGPWIGLAYHVAAMKPIALTLFLALATADPMAACRSGSLDQAVRAMIDAYRFNLDPVCGSNFVNECIDDFSQAAVGYAWMAAYERRSDRPDRAAALAAQAREWMHRVLAVDEHLCTVTGSGS